MKYKKSFFQLIFLPAVSINKCTKNFEAVNNTLQRTVAKKRKSFFYETCQINTNIHHIKTFFSSVLRDRNYSLPLINRWSSWSVNVLSFLTTNAFGTSPDSGSEIPITPTSATLSWRSRSSSSSAGATLKTIQVSQKRVKLFWYDGNTNGCDFTHLESFHFDELLYSIDDVNKSFVIVITDISSVQPTFCVNSLGSRLWIIVVTFHNLGMTRVLL